MVRDLGKLLTDCELCPNKTTAPNALGWRQVGGKWYCRGCWEGAVACTECGYLCGPEDVPKVGDAWMCPACRAMETMEDVE